ncbi:uncharacterized protein UHOD_11198 [Ustilago sp. UG-2017b]|nr:uncharacterized protein UHOD_11198 [Ustilago sp. UG-2017b]
MVGVIVARVAPRLLVGRIRLPFYVINDEARPCDGLVRGLGLAQIASTMMKEMISAKKEKNLDPTVSEALSGDDRRLWEDAMRKELDGLEAMGVMGLDAQEGSIQESGEQLPVERKESCVSDTSEQDNRRKSCVEEVDTQLKEDRSGATGTPV